MSPKKHMASENQSVVTSKSRHIFAALRHANYRWFWISGFGHTAAQGLKQITLALLVLQLTGSVGQLGIVVFMQGAPMAGIALFGGVVADRYDRKNILQISQIASMINILIVAILSFMGDLMLWHIYVSAIILGIGQALTMPARQALIRSLVPSEDVLNAVALNSMQQHTSRILWPTIGAGFVAFMGASYALLLIVAAYVVGVYGLIMVRNLPPIDRVGTDRSPIRDLTDGLRYTFTTPLTQTIMVLAVSIGMFGLAYMNMAPGFGRDAMEFSETEIGLFVSISGIGSLVGSLFLLAVDVKNKLALYVAQCLVFASSLILLSLNPFYFLSFFLMFIWGITTSSLSIVAQTMIQVSVPQHLLGRVISLWSFAGGLGSVMALPMGIVGELFGMRISLGSVAVILLVLSVWFGVLPLARGKVKFEAPSSLD